MKLSPHWTPRLFYATAVVLGLAYVVVTPPLTVPDERGHFWSGVGIARGHVLPAPSPRPIVIDVDRSLREFTWHVQERRERPLYDREFRERTLPIRWAGTDLQAWLVPLYTPVPYLPEALSAVAGSIVRARPLLIFYGGRAANLLVWMGVVALALRIAPAAAPVFAVVALLPMTLFLFGSWSADAAAIASAILFTAMAVREAAATDGMSWRNALALAAGALLLTLCKPAYSLLPAVVVAIPSRRFASRAQQAGIVAVVAAATLMGTATSMLYFNRAYFNLRPDLPIDPAAQTDCIRHDPMRFARVVARDIGSNGRFYVDQVAGRFAHNEIKLQDWVWRTEWIALALIAATTTTGVGRGFRIVAGAIAAASAIAIITSQYLIWSVVCSDVVEGVQGRYFLPLLPLLAVAVGGMTKWRLPAIALMVVAVICNAAAIATIVVWYA